MPRFITLLLVLFALMALFAIDPIDTTQSQTGRQIPRATNVSNRAVNNPYNGMDICVGKTMEDWDRSVQLNPNNSTSYTNRAWCRSSILGNTSMDDYLRLLPTVKAGIKADLDRALSIDPENAQAYLVRAQKALMWSGYGVSRDEIEQVSRDLNKAAVLQSDNPHVYFHRARLKFELLKDNAGAIADLDQAIRMRPDEVFFLTERANILMKTGDPAGAARDLTAILRKDPDPYTRLQRAEAYRLSGQNAKALADLNLVLRQERNLEEAVLGERVKVFRALGNNRAAADDERRLKQLERNRWRFPEDLPPVNRSKP